METADWITLLQIAVAILLPGVGFLAHQTISNSRELSKLGGEFTAYKGFLESSVRDIKNRLASIEEAIRNK